MALEGMNVLCGARAQAGAADACAMEDDLSLMSVQKAILAHGGESRLANPSHQGKSSSRIPY
jgi:hypothetical protein